MKIYYIMIVKPNGLQTNIKDESNIEAFIQEELGGWANLHYSMCSNHKLGTDNFQAAGTTKSDFRSFSIICVAKS